MPPRPARCPPPSYQERDHHPPPAYTFVSSNSTLRRSESFSPSDSAPNCHSSCTHRGLPICRPQLMPQNERTPLLFTANKSSLRERVLFVTAALVCTWLFWAYLPCFHPGRGPGVDENQRHFYWDNLHPGLHCSAYGTREYSARLMNIPTSYNWMKACQNMPVTIHNTTINTPDRCEDRGFSGGVHGFWLIDFNEIACLPMWGDFIDENCTAEGSRLHRTVARLWNIQNTDNWMQMCATTPADLHGFHFDGPKHCVHKGLWGIYGVWEYEDQSC